MMREDWPRKSHSEDEYFQFGIRSSCLPKDKNGVRDGKSGVQKL